MNRWVAVGLYPIFTLVLVWPVLADQTAPTAESLTALVFRFLDAADSNHSDRTLDAILAHPDASLDRVSRIIQTERPYQSQAIGALPNEQVQTGGRDYPLALSIPLTYQPSKGYALVLCLHGAGFTGEAYLERWQARLGEDYILACPTYPAGAWFTRQAEDVALATIHQVRRRYHIDPDRIFLTGMSNGGIGAWLIGMHHASLFAGIAPMASGLDEVLMPFLANLKHTPVYIIHGAKDQVMPVELSQSISRELTALGYPHVYREHQREHPMAGGHFFPREELPALVQWFDHQRRNPAPSSLTLVREASHFQSFGWMRIDATDPIAAFSDDLVSKRDDNIKQKRYARLTAAVAAPNRIEVTTESVRRYSLFLNDQLIDLAKPVTVITNGQISYEGPVLPSIETLLRQARIRQDPRMLFPVQLSLTVKAPAP